ncbi:MAG: hypothetical protein A3K77_07540 [Euryarchaeota archaeon RBG_13_31_8]|nr:MAG: hypothetical protein A3K77_07540 [Euryarchaeota archaeon RBG_13_31_8]
MKMSKEKSKKMNKRIQIIEIEGVIYTDKQIKEEIAKTKQDAYEKHKKTIADLRRRLKNCAEQNMDLIEKLKSD